MQIWTSESKRVPSVQEIVPVLKSLSPSEAAHTRRQGFGKFCIAVLRDTSSFLNIFRVPGFQFLNKQADVSAQPS